jgi:hypothetical protein
MGQHMYKKMVQHMYIICTNSELNMDYLLIELYALLKIEVIFHYCCSSQQTAHWRGTTGVQPASDWDCWCIAHMWVY